jgi:hypothetical protein
LRDAGSILTKENAMTSDPPIDPSDDPDPVSEPLDDPAEQEEPSPDVGPTPARSAAEEEKILDEGQTQPPDEPA